MNPPISELFDLSDRVAVITGGGGWLGSAMAEALAQAGALAIAVDINAEALERNITPLRQAGLSVVEMTADMNTPQAIAACLDEVVARYGRLDILINCAYSGRQVSLDESDFEGLDNQFRVGPAAYGVAAARAAHYMKQAQGGAIVNIASILALSVTSRHSVAYAAGKNALINMTRHMAVQWAPCNIRVNAISPGNFPRNYPTPRAYPAGRVDRCRELTPMGRSGARSEIKGAVVLLTSAAGSYITGHNLVIDGGWSLW